MARTSPSSLRPPEVGTVGCACAARGRLARSERPQRVDIGSDADTGLHVGSLRMRGLPATPRRYASIAALTRVLPARQLIPFWVAIGLTFSALAFLIDVMARGQSAPLTLVLNVLFSALIAVGIVWSRMTGR